MRLRLSVFLSAVICFHLALSDPTCDTDRGFVQSGDDCFLYIDLQMNFHDADDYCRLNYDSSLSSVLNANEQNYLYTVGVSMNEDVMWIGLSDGVTPGNLQWSNGYDNFDPVTYNNYGTNGSFIVNPGSSCVQSDITSNGQWFVTRCSEEKAFTCKKKLGETCPLGWIYGDGKCYDFHLNSNLFVTWTEARDVCRAQNAKLLKIESLQEQQFIASFFANWKTLGILQMWLGISDIGHDQTLTWSDETDIGSYTPWDGDPNSKMQAQINDCSWIFTGKSDDNWEIGNCFSLQAFACEIKEGSSISTIPVPIVEYSCPDGWRLYGINCYFFDKTQQNWDTALQFCKSKGNGADLASIHDAGEQSFISGHVIGQSWIGLTDRAVEGTYVWSDGTPTDFFNWKFSQPSLDGDCVRLIGIDDDNAWGAWNDRACSETVLPICKVAATYTGPQEPPTAPTNPDETFCGTGYVHNPTSHKCYKIVGDYVRQWADARLHCQQEGGELVSFNSPEEQSFIQAYTAFMDVGAFWTGGYDSYNGYDFIPDNIDAFDGGWRWSDGSAFNFINWAAGEPNQQGDEDCLEFRSASGEWNDITCDGYYGYICEKEDPHHDDEVEETVCTGDDCCFRHLGVEKYGTIEDNQLSSSSQLDAASNAARGRLNTIDQYFNSVDMGGRGAWISADNDPAPWFQVDLKDWFEVRGVVTQGRNGFNQPYNQNNWLKSYSVQYMGNPARGIFEDYRELSGNIAIFDANYNQNDQVTNIFTRPIVTTAIRILAVECRKKCALRMELLGCKPDCFKSLGVSKDAVNSDLPVLPDANFAASSEQPGYEAANARLDYSGGQLQELQHYTKPGSEISWDNARAFCISEGGDLCTQQEICPTGVPVIGVQTGDQWAPIRDGVNDWVEVGDDNNPNPGRVCWVHNDHYGPPGWGQITGACPPYDTPTDPCPHKKHIFCCPVNLKSWKPTTSSVNEWLQVDLNEFRKVSGVVVQGDLNSDDWVKDYYISFSEDGTRFSTYNTPSGNKELFPGNFDSSTPVEGFLREPISTRYIRIEPQSWNNNIALRLDILGCEVGNRAYCTDIASSYSDEEFTIDCPTGCDQGPYNVWGTAVYTDDSYICTAAIHDGRFTADHGGTVRVKKVAGLETYVGSVQHGISTSNYGSWPASYIFQGDHLGCPSGWVGWKDWCYYITRRSSKVDWSSASQRCQSYGGDLVSINSQAEQNFVVSLVFYGYESVDDVWIGMSDLDQLNYYQWSDGSDVKYTRWDHGEPNGGHERCVHMYKWSGLWNDHSCDTVMNYMCKMEKIPINQDQEVVDGCPAGWKGNEASCYLFDLTASVWTNAETFCVNQGGHLATVNNYYEQMFISSQAAQVSHSDDDTRYLIGLGAFVDPTGAMTFQWSSGEPVTFTAWGVDEPYIAHQCSFPFLYEGVSYYECISIGRPYELLNGPWCSADPVYTNHAVPCEGRDNGQVGCITLDKSSGMWYQANPVGCGSPNYRICEIPRIGYTTPQGPTAPSPNGDCPNGWYGWSNGTFCYQINDFADTTQQLSWEDAKFHCESQGSNLASIHSSQEEHIILTGIQGNDPSYAFWVGLKRGSDGLMGWSDKTPLSYTNWADGEPNNHNGRENCVEIYFSSNNTEWNDLNCDAARNWICKIERGRDLFPAITAPPGTLSPGICGSDQDWAAYTSSYTGVQKCYYFATTPLMSWQAAKSACENYGGNLVIISSQDEQSFITARGTKTGISEMWIGMLQDGTNGPYVWIDKSPVQYQNWMGNQPDNNNGQELCVEMKTYAGLWSDNNCGISTGYICQKYPGAAPQPPAPTTLPEGGCPYQWLPYGGQCFLEVGFTDNSLKMNWEDAEAYCNTKGGFLASVKNKYYNAFLTSQLYGGKNSNLWIGLHTTRENRVFIWADNSDLYYTNWNTNEPNNSENLEDCVELLWTTSHAGRWNDLKCSETRPFYCSRDKSTDYQDLPVDSAICPDGYLEWDTSCYKLYSEPSQQKNWAAARQQCVDDGSALGMTMELASIWNVYENNFLLTNFWPTTGVDIKYMWSGMYYNNSNGASTFQWSDHSPVVFTQWAENEPQNIDQSTGCVRVNEFGNWENMPQAGCNSMLPFVCKHETLMIPEQDPGLGICEDGWVSFGEYCYNIVFGHNDIDLRSWGDANDECEKRMGYLASIHDPLENKFVLSASDHKTLWLGLGRNGWGGWEWSDSSPVDYTNWAPSEPNNVGEAGEACVEFYNTGMWNDNYCSNTRGYVCKKHKTYATCNFPSDDRVNCGYDGINEYECLERLCCWDDAGLGPHACFYSKYDAACIEKGGACKDYRYNQCELGYEQYLCGGALENRCCYSCATDDDTCNGQVDDWESQDQNCENGGYGTCQYNSNYCPSSVYESNKCGGPGNRQCCVRNPPTNPPDGPQTTTDPTKPTDPNNPPTKPTDPNNPPDKTTTKAKTTQVPTIVSVQDNSGLDGGGIAGIIIAVIFVAIAGVVGFYLYRKTSIKSSILGSSSAVAGFDNPILYNKDSEQTDTLTMDKTDEFDA